MQSNHVVSLLQGQLTDDALNVDCGLRQTVNDVVNYM